MNLRQLWHSPVSTSPPWQFSSCVYMFYSGDRLGVHMMTRQCRGGGAGVCPWVRPFYANIPTGGRSFCFSFKLTAGTRGHWWWCIEQVHTHRAMCWPAVVHACRPGPPSSGGVLTSRAGLHLEPKNVHFPNAPEYQRRLCVTLITVKYFLH